MLALSTIQLKANQDILEVVLNRESCCNAINSTMMLELLQLWQWLNESNTWRCVILTGSGERAFCAGADLKERYKLDLATWQQQHSVLQQAMLAMHACHLPIVAAVNGVAFGGGLELLLGCDFAYAADHAVFAQSEVKLGIMPGAMGTQQLPRAVGLRRAKELTLTAEAFDAQSALQWGLVNQVLPLADLHAAVMKVATKIVANAPLAVHNAKRALNRAVCHDLVSGYGYEVKCYNELLNTKDRIEGINAFNEKRKPNFRGE